MTTPICNADRHADACIGVNSVSASDKPGSGGDGEEGGGAKGGNDRHLIETLVADGQPEPIVQECDRGALPASFRSQAIRPLSITNV